MNAPPSRLLDNNDLDMRGGILDDFLVGEVEAEQIFISLSEWEKSLSTEAKDSKLLEESIVKLLGASCVSR